MIEHMLTIELEGLPPSQNHAYANLPTGGRRLTEEARGYKSQVTNYVARNHIKELSSLLANKPYEVYITFFFLYWDLFNKGYPKKTKNRYKRVDTLNRGKLLEDALADAVGFDDSHNFVMHLEKRPCDRRWTEIKVYRKEDEWTMPGEE
jgi:hypothetical protein